MTYRTGLTALALAALTAPAAATAPDWDAAGAAYRATKASGISAVTENEQALCAATWSEWVSAAINQGGVPAEAASRLGPDLVAPDARLRTVAWLLWLEQGDDPDARDAAFNRFTPTARTTIAKALAGDAGDMRGVMEMLGSCQNPGD